MAPIAMLTVKGGRTHRRWGKVYFWAMAAVALTAVVLAVWRPVVFLALMAVFSFYSAFYGYRVLARKRPERGERASAPDWTAAGVMLAASAALVVLGLLRPGPTWQRLGAVPVVFGGLGLLLAGLDLQRFARPPGDRNAWWFGHMRGMLGSYIATLTAFSVVNLTFLPLTLRWLWPTVIGTPLIVLWIAYYKRRVFRGGRAVAAAPAP